MPHKDAEKRKAYSKEYGARWYQSHKESVIARRKQQQKGILNWFRRYKSTLKCSGCGVSHPALLCFHHRDPREKEFTISKIVAHASSVKRMQQEIAKCDVLCVNCHMKFHWRERHATDDWEEILVVDQEKEAIDLMEIIQAELAQEMGEKGRVIRAKAEKSGYKVTLPFNENHRYNMLLEKEGESLRLLCRDGQYRNGAITFKACSVQWFTRMKRNYSREEIDYFAVYSKHTNEVYFVPPEDVAPTGGMLRVLPAANNQTKGVRLAKDYEMQKRMEEYKK